MMLISRLFIYWNESFLSDIFISNIKVTDVINVKFCWHKDRCRCPSMVVMVFLQRKNSSGPDHPCKTVVSIKRCTLIYFFFNYFKIWLNVQLHSMYVLKNATKFFWCRVTIQSKSCLKNKNLKNECMPVIIFHFILKIKANSFCFKFFKIQF